MAQVTPRTLFDALMWIHTNSHSEVGTEFKDGVATATYFKNFHEKMRVPNSSRCAWAERFHTLVEPSRRKHDDRMFALTRHGKQILRQWVLANHPYRVWMELMRDHP